MTKIDSLRRLLLPCFSSSSTAATATYPVATTKKRLSTSLRDDLPNDTPTASQDQPLLTTHDDDDDDDDDSDDRPPHLLQVAPPRPSKTMVVGTIFGSRSTCSGSHVFFCVQHDRLSTKAFLLLELSIPTHQLTKEMRFGLVRVALESDRPEFRSVPLRSVPVWTMNINGKKFGFALKRKTSEKIRLMLKTMQNTTVGAGVIPSPGAESGSEEGGEIMYMRANYEHVVGGADVESFHLINPEQGPVGGGQELSFFLMRSSR